MSNYDRDTEWAPHPQKAEHIFISVVVKEAFQRGWMDADGDQSLEERISHVVTNAAKAWRSYVKMDFYEAAGAMQAAQSIDALDRIAQGLRNYRLTEEELEQLRVAYREHKAHLQKHTETIQ